MKTKHTPGEWKKGKRMTIVTEERPEWIKENTGHGETEYYGGFLIAESIINPYDIKLIAAAPVMLDALIDICKTIDCLIKQSQEGVSINESFNVPPILVESTNKCISAIKKATE